MAIVTFNGGGGGHTANKGSCADLEAYKEHEKLLRAQEGRAQQTNAKCDIFGADGIMSAEESTRFIDAHRKGLKKDEAKFYEFEINLSEGEQLAMFRDCSTEAQKEKVFQDYIRNVVMEEYARNFKGYTDKFGAAVEFHKENICWTAAIHTERYGVEAVKWKREHPDMDRSDWHAHVTVAHRTMDQTRSISPKKNQRSSNKGSCQGFFDRNSFRERIEQTIDMHFDYERPLSDTLRDRQDRRLRQETLLNDVNCDQAKKQGHDAAIARIAAVKRRKHMEAEALKARLDREAAERRAAAEAKRQAEQKAKAEAEHKAAAERERLAAIEAKKEAERLAAEEAKQQAELKAREEAERRAAAAQQRRAAAEAKKEAERLAAAKARENKLSAVLESPEGLNAVKAIVANAVDLSKPMRYHISRNTAQSIYIALGLVEVNDTKELTERLISSAKNGMGSSPVNWVELLRPDIEKVAEISIAVKGKVGTGESYYRAVSLDDWSFNQNRGLGR